MNLEQYQILLPYRKQLYISEELGSCIQGKLCLELANIHYLLGYGSVDTTCGNCVKDMLTLLWEQIRSFEKNNNIGG